MWRSLRIVVLLVVLLTVATGAWFDRRRTSEWQHTLWIGIFPINGDGREATDRYIASLARSDFAPLEAFFLREARRYGVPITQPIRIELYAALDAVPPRLPPGANAVQSVIWSLRMRYFAWAAARDTLANVRMFVLYHDPERTERVPHSLGLQKGLLGVVYAFAEPEMDGQNNIVIAHELMHALGASDKYHPASNLPVFPGGYADPQAQPRYPQRAAEIMAGRLALTAGEASMPDTLTEVVVGSVSASEINWITD